MAGILAQQRVERVEVAGGRAFADRDLAAGRQLVERLLLGEALVIGRDAGGDVLGRLLAAQAGCVAVDRFAAIVGACTLARHPGSPYRMPGKFIISLR